MRGSLIQSANWWITLAALSCFSGVWVHLSSCGPTQETPTEDTNLIDNPSNPYPHVRGQEFRGEKNFAVLMNNYQQGKPASTPWAGYWWPYTKNGIAAGFGGASPAGKYDAARGGTTRSQSWEIRNHGSAVPRVQSWWGHCNGWAVAAALFPEPRAATRVNGILFGIADIKALLTEAGMEASADFYGERVDYGNHYSTPRYTDVVPDQYFLVLTTYMGKLRETVLIDRHTGHEVWNQPLVGYHFQYPKPEDVLPPDPRAPGVHRILVTSTIWWAEDNVPPDVQTPPFEFQENSVFSSRTLKMEIWLDDPVVFGADGRMQSSGNVIVTREGEYLVGGQWRMGDGHLINAWPDYMWIPYSVMKPTDYANNQVDIDWIRKHVLEGRDDPSVSPRPIEPPPVPSTSPHPSPTHSYSPVPIPSFTLSPRPTPTRGDL